MGGFTLIGPKYRFSNRDLVKSHCKCLGLSEHIDTDTENILYMNESQQLSMNLLPTDLAQKCKSAHLGDTLKYVVFEITIRPIMNWDLIRLRRAQMDEFLNPEANGSEKIKTPLGEIPENIVKKYLPEYSNYKIQYRNWSSAQSPIEPVRVRKEDHQT